MTLDAVTLVLSVLLASALLVAAVALAVSVGDIARARARLRGRPGRTVRRPRPVPGSAGVDADLARVLHDLDARPLPEG